MRSTAKRLFERTAGDLMTRDLITIPKRMSLHAAAHRLSETGVSGVPVTDDEGRCVGVLSRGDIVRAMDEEPGLQARPSPYFADWQMAEEEGGGGEAGRFMTPALIAVSPEASLGEVAWTMCSARVHRVLVMDDSGRVVGVISSLDVLGAVAEEAN